MTPQAGPENPDTAQVVGSITMRPPQLYMDSLGLAVQTYAIAYAEDGRRLYSSAEYPDRFSWSSSGPSVVSVNQSGSVTSGSWGTATITATHQRGLAGATYITVRDAVRLAWSLPNLGNVRAGIAVGADGTIYAMTRTRLYAISTDGVVLWTLGTPSDVISTPAIGIDGTLYFGSLAGRGLTALRSDGTILWERSDLGSISSSPTLAPDGTIYVGSSNSHVYAVDPQGELVWAYEGAGGFVFSSPAVASDGVVYVGSSDEHLHAINPDGSGRWMFKAGGEVQRGPAIGPDGTIYFGSHDHRLYAVNPDGTEGWSLPVLVNSSPAIGSDGTIYVGGWGVSAIDPAGSVRWTYAPNGGSIMPVLGADGTVYVANTNGLVISALNAEGRLLWDYPTGSLAGGPPAVGLDGTLYATSEDGTLYALVENGPTNGGFEGSPWPKEHGNRANTGRAGG